MNILLCSPKDHGHSFLYRSEPLNLGYIAAYLHLHSDHSATIVTEDDYENDGDVFQNHNFEILALSVFISNVSAARRMSVLAKEQGKTVIWGGSLPTGMPELILDSCVDYFVLGEGEAAFLDLIIAIDQGRPREECGTLPGVAFESGRKLVQGPRRDLIPDLDLIPFPERVAQKKQHIFGDKLLFQHPDPDWFPIFFSRGCYFSCPTCSNELIWHRKWRSRSVENFLEEVSQASRLRKTNRFYLLDAEPLARLKISWELLVALENENYEWVTSTAAINLNEKTLKQLHRSRCKGLNIGLESGSQRVQSWMGKGLEKPGALAAAVENIRKAENLGIKCMVAFLVGCVPEGKSDLVKSRALIRKTQGSLIIVSYLLPLPGTRHFQTALEENLLIVRQSLEEMGNSGQPSIRTRKLNEAELRREFILTFLTAMFSPSMWMRITKNICGNPKFLLIYMRLSQTIVSTIFKSIINRFSGKPSKVSIP